MNRLDRIEGAMRWRQSIIDTDYMPLDLSDLEALIRVARMAKRVHDGDASWLELGDTLAPLLEEV